jgi:hypothetical protein
MTTAGLMRISADELNAQHAMWYSYARMLRRYRWVYWGFSVLAILIILKLYTFKWDLGLDQAVLISLLCLIFLTTSVSLFIDSSFSLEKYGADAEARKLVDYNFYLTSLSSALWGCLSLVIIYHQHTIDYELLALLGVLVCLNIPRAAILQPLFYLQTALIALPGIFFMLLQGRWASATVMILAALAITIAINAMVMLLKAHQEHEQQLLVEMRQPQKNNLLNTAEFDVLLKLEWQYAAREHQYLSVLKLELQPNDSKQLPHIISVIKTALYRSSDCLAYLEGCNFKVLLPNTSAEQALLIAERLQSRFAQEDLDTEEALHLSLGLVTCSPSSIRSGISTSSSIEQLNTELDAVMAEAKAEETRFSIKARKF